MIHFRMFFHAVCLFLFFTLLTGCGSEPGENKNKLPATQWIKIGPGGGGATFIPTFSYHNPDNFLIRCDMTGTYLTYDGGESYSQINYAGGSTSFAWDPVDSNIVYIGSSTLNRSADRGKTWEQIFPSKEEVLHEIYRGDHADYSIETSESSLYPANEGRIDAIRIDPVHKGTIFFSMGPWFFYTDNYGKTWKRKEIGQDITYIYTNETSLKNKVYIFSASSVYIFDKLSFTIEKKSLPDVMAPAFSFTGGTLPDTERVIFYALHHDTAKEIQNEFGYSEVWISEDLGETWNRIMNSLLTNAKNDIKPSYSMIACAEYDAGRAYLITNRYEEKKEGDKLIYWYGALKTGDAGSSWDWVWKGGGGSGQYGIKDGIGVSNLKDAWVKKAFGGEYIRLMDAGVAPSNGNIAVVTDWYRTMKTVDGGNSWKEIYSEMQSDGSFFSRGLDVTTAYGVHFDPFDSNHIAISYTDIGYHHSYDRGKTWIRSAEGVPDEWVNTCYWMVFDPEIKNKIWSAWSSLHDFPRGKMTRNPKWKELGKGGVCVSLDGGRTWKPTVEGMGFDSPATSIILDPESSPGNRTLYTSVYSKGVYKSTDDGKTWQHKNNGIGDNTCAFELSLTKNGVLFLTVSATPNHKENKKGESYYSGAVYRSTDGAENWERLNVSEGPLFPNSIETDPDNPDRLFLGCWSDIELSDLVGRNVAGREGGNVLIDMPGGIFLSEDGGDIWRQIFDEDQYVYDIEADPYHPGRLYCNTFNRAAYMSYDYGKNWQKIKGYDFHWGQRVIVDRNDPEFVYITTFGSSVWHGKPVSVNQLPEPK